MTRTAPGAARTGRCAGAAPSLVPALARPLAWALVLLTAATAAAAELPRADFGTVSIGSWTVQEIALRHDGPDTLRLDGLVPGAEGLSAAPSPALVPPGGDYAVELAFRPDGPAPLGTVVRTADGAPLLYVTGTVVSTPFGLPDRIGIFFDEALTTNQIATGKPDAVVTGYIALVRGSIDADLAYWEARVEIAGQGELRGWNLAGDAVNGTDFPGIKASLKTPLPHAENRILASFECLVRSVGELQLIFLKAVDDPLVEDAMSWVGRDRSDLRHVMRTTTGSWYVAGINAVAVPVIRDPEFDFGPTPVGTEVRKLVRWRNTTDDSLTLDFVSDDPAVAASARAATVAPHSSVNVDLVYRPDALRGVDAGVRTIDGTHVIRLRGKGDGAPPGEPDRLGVWFDEELRTNTATTTAPYELVTGYVALRDRSGTDPLGYWECRIEVDAPAIVGNLTLVGNAANLGTAPEIKAALTAPPPWEPDQVLARFACYVPAPTDDIRISLAPPLEPEFPGAMSWRSQVQPDLSRRLHTATGRPEVAAINAHAASDVPGAAPGVTRLHPAYPNPFNPQTTIRFDLAGPRQVDLKIYDVTGRLVIALVDEALAAGPHARVWDGRDAAGRRVASGAYYARLVTKDGVDRRKLMLVK